jgi:UDP-N-acetyl-D-glucosamine dehydrogenase
MINIGLANEMAQVCDRLGVNAWEVIDAATINPFGYMKFTPGPGIGGHCIPIDPHYLAWKMRTLRYKMRMISAADNSNHLSRDNATLMSRQTQAAQKQPVLRTVVPGTSLA